MSSNSWFTQIRDICLLYKLPHPIQLLKNQLSKENYKKLVKSHVVDHWEELLRAEAALLSSLTFFLPNFMSLTKPHPLWSTAESSPSKISMATVQARMISGRYRTEMLCSNWSKNTSGCCLLSTECKLIPEDIPHILANCAALQETRHSLKKFTTVKCRSLTSVTRQLIDRFCTPSSPKFIQFLLDCSVLPEVISAVQQEGADVLFSLFGITRTWVYTLHKDRLKQLNRWNLI